MEKLKEIFAGYGVKLAYLFGSQKEKGAEFLSGKTEKPERGSDLDIGLVFGQFPREPLEIYGELYAGLAVIFEPFEIDLVFLQETEVLFQYEAIKGILIYSEDEVFLDSYEEMIMKQAGDLCYKKMEFEEDFLEAVQNGYFEIAS